MESPSPKSREILGRFPRHLEVDQQGKLIGVIVDALAGDLDTVSAQLGRTRRAHRIGHADEDRDLLLLAALHGLDLGAFDILRRRLIALETPVDYATELDLMRARISGAISVFRRGNGTIRALLDASAVHLDLIGEGPIEHFDEYWHILPCRDRIAPDEDVQEYLALEENPYRLMDETPVERWHAKRFIVRRGGFEPAPVTVRVLGLEDRTVWPMVVNLDRHRGVAFAGTVPDGAELRFESDGRVTLDGAEVTRSAYAFEGALFGDASAPHENDDRWDESSFAVTEPVGDRFQEDAIWPHLGALIETPMIDVGESRWAFFVRGAHFGVEETSPVRSRAAIAYFNAGVWDQSVYSDVPPPSAAAKVGLEWLEQEPFAFKVWIPSRFAELDAEGETDVKERVRLALDRHRAAGVHAYVEYQSETWVLGEGVIRDLDSENPLGIIIAGSALSPEPTEG